ncbi:PAS domain-containing protein, partial [Streptomyces sp. NPDC005574]|uniref:PAS domain-containing protein n=1 Tax=Streptomyces sp. NPDC005574 TaxID=3156891 RepID=UPI0033B85A47
MWSDEVQEGDGSLDAALADTVRRTGASIGGLYLIERAEPMLRLVSLCGLPDEFAAPWHRVPLSAPVPVTDAIREDGIVWVGGQEEMARRYPRAAAVLPYRFALAAVPVTGAHRCWGGIVLMWPADHPPETTARERGHITSSARLLGRLLEDAPGLATLPGRPRIVPADVARHPGQTGLAAVDYLERLPEGAVSLDFEGRITFVSATATRLLGRSAERLLGTRPWQSLPWLDSPVYEDHYRTAVISRAPVSFSARRTPGQCLDFQLHPDASGISVRVTRCADEPSGDQPAHTPHTAAPHTA